MTGRPEHLNEGVDRPRPLYWGRPLRRVGPDVFVMDSDGLAYVAEGGVQLPGGGPDALAVVPEPLYEATIESAEECPGECIYIEVG